MTKSATLLNSRPVVILTTLSMIVAVGMADYLSGYEMSFSVFYLFAISFALWFAGKGFSIFACVLSVGCSIAGDIAAGVIYANKLIPIWNALISAVFYLSVIGLLSRLKLFQDDLEERVRQRTLALTEEMAERERLEKEILAISERERQRIGHDLHDSLCQHLTGTAIAGQVLGEKLAAKSLPEAADIENVICLIEEGITMARNMARGLSPVDFEAHGLMDAYRELAAAMSERFKIHCEFQCEGTILLNDDVAAVHLYRIVQEAVSNAIRHGKAKRVVINLSKRDGRLLLIIKDNGSGLPDIGPDNQGMGLRIMKQRSKMIGADFSAQRDPAGGTIVTCSFINAMDVDENRRDNKNNA